MLSYLEHPHLLPQTVDKRIFQMELAATALKGSSLIVVPTGLGKTIIALMVLLARMDKGRVLFLAPTKPLVEQHAAFLQRVLKDPSIVSMMTGESAPVKRMASWENSRIIVSTPQVIENDLLARRIDLKNVSLVIFDEAHRAVGGYAYVYIADRYHREATEPLVLGITASPGSQSEKIAEICSNLGIERVQTRTEDDPDVSEFVHEREIEWVKLDVPKELLAIRNSIEDLLKSRIDDLNRLAVSPLRIDLKSSKKELLGLQASLMSSARVSASKTTFAAISLLAEILKLHHAVELAETQGPDSLGRYFQRLEGEALSRSGSKASRRINQDPMFRRTVAALGDLKAPHPKPAAAKSILLEQIGSDPNSRIMVFTNYRDTATSLLKFLKDEPAIRAVRFVGQSSRENDEGLSQKKQAEILQKFRSGEFNVLIATSVGEEGIDIPATDMVLFYEPVPSEIRSIQRKGRTGRARAGRVVVLMARGTRDEAYYWISDRKEKTMNRQIRKLSGDVKSLHPEAQTRQAQIGLEAASYAKSEEAATHRQRVDGIEDESVSLIGQSRILEHEQSLAEGRSQGEKKGIDIHSEDAAGSISTAVLVDFRERDMAKLLESQGQEVILRSLEVGDYVISDRVAVERKTASDFVSSIIDPQRNLFRQIADLARAYERPVMILEGRNLYSTQMNPGSIQGAMASVAVDYGVPIIPTEDQNESAKIIAMLARRERALGREVKMHGHKTARTLKEQQEYLISAIPSVGPAVAKKLLVHFGSIERVMTASEEELQVVDLVGPKIAQRIRELVGGEYKG